MAYTMLDCLGVQYAVDWDVVRRLCKSYWRTYYQRYYSDTVEMSESAWYNPLSWSLPTIKTVDVNWDRVRESSETALGKDMEVYTAMARRDMRSVAYDVKYKLEQTAVLSKRYNDDLKDLQSANMAAIEGAVDDYTGFAEAARFVRDTSADVVAVGSTIATGGAATGLLVGSSALKGVYKYQDTGSVGAAVVYGGGSLALGAFKVGGKKLTTGGEYALIVFQGALETGTSVVAGDTFAKAVDKGVLKVATAGGAQALFGSNVVKDACQKLPIPFNVWSVTQRQGHEFMATDVANDLLEKGGKKLLEKGSKKAIEIARKPSPDRASRATSAGVADEVPLQQTMLLYLSIVNMNNGIGRGW